MKMKEGQRKGENLVLVGLDSFSLKSETCLGPFWLNLHQQGPWHSSFHQKKRLGDILSQRQIVPPAFFGRQIVPDDKMSHFLPMRQIVPATKCPISSPATKCPTDDPSEKPLFHWHFSGDKLSQGDKMSHFLPGDKMSQLMHLCTGKLWKVVGTFCRQ